MRMASLYLVLLLVLTACKEKQSFDIHSGLFDCEDFASKYSQKYSDLWSDKDSRDARKRECRVAKGFIEKDYSNIPMARYYLAENYKSFGDHSTSIAMYKAAIAALQMDDKWKSPAACSSAAMAAGELARIEETSMADRFKFAKVAALWGNQNGTFYYATFLEQGRGGLIDIISAYAWYNITAAHSGGIRASSAREKLSKLEALLPIQSRLEAQSLSKKLHDEIANRKECKILADSYF